MLHVLIDGDNIQWETFVDNVKQEIDRRFGTDYVPTIFCQTHILVKFHSLRETNLCIRAARTTKKNAADVRMLMEIGKLSTDSKNIIVVVSNDKIFEEVVDNENIFQVGYLNNFKKTIISKKVVKQAMCELAVTTEDVHLCDLFEKINCKSISSLREYINKFIPDLYVAANDVVSFV